MQFKVVKPYSAEECVFCQPCDFDINPVTVINLIKKYKYIWYSLPGFSIFCSIFLGQSPFLMSLL